MIEIKGRYTTALLTIDEFEEGLIKQVHSMVNHVAFNNKIVIMPDAHQGKGATVGFSMLLGDRVLPSVVGTDIGCSVISVNIGNKLNISLKEIDDKIRENIPMGININENSKRYGSLPDFSFKEQFPWKKANDILNKFIVEYNKRFVTNYSSYPFDYRYFIEKCNQIGIKVNRAEMALKSCGGGNHFVSISKSDNCGDLWIEVHTGSRNFGKCVYEYHQKVAQKNIDDKRSVVLRNKIEIITKTTEDKTKISKLIKDAKIELGLDSDVDIKGQEYLQGQDAFNYLVDMVFAQQYAEFNRNEIIKTILEILGAKEKDRIECVHNYIDFRDFIIRKGAIRSYIGERILIPLNMADGTLICEGKSNPEWNFTSPHGAGRSMSRTKAKETCDMDEFKKQMEGIYSTSIVRSVLDECPNSYKSPKMIEAAITPTATVIDRLIPILNIKDKNSGPSFKERKEEKKRNQEREERRNLKEKNR